MGKFNTEHLDADGLREFIEALEIRMDVMVREKEEAEQKVKEAEQRAQDRIRESRDFDREVRRFEQDNLQRALDRYRNGVEFPSGVIAYVTKFDCSNIAVGSATISPNTLEAFGPGAEYDIEIRRGNYTYRLSGMRCEVIEAEPIEQPTLSDELSTTREYVSFSEVMQRAAASSMNMPLSYIRGNSLPPEEDGTEVTELRVDSNFVPVYGRGVYVATSQDGQNYFCDPRRGTAYVATSQDGETVQTEVEATPEDITAIQAGPEAIRVAREAIEAEAEDDNQPAADDPNHIPPV